MFCFILFPDDSPGKKFVNGPQCVISIPCLLNTRFPILKSLLYELLLKSKSIGPIFGSSNRKRRANWKIVKIPISVNSVGGATCTSKSVSSAF